MTTLRDIQTEFLLPVRTPEELEANIEELQGLFAEAAAWTARVYASSLSDISDSTLDAQTAMISAIADFHNIIYGHDQTMTTRQAIEYWLDSENAIYDLIGITYYNIGLTEELDKTRPRLFGYFDLTDDIY